MVTNLPKQRSMSLMPIVLRKLYTNYELNRTKELVTNYTVVAMVAMLAVRHVTDACCPKEAPCQI